MTCCLPLFLVPAVEQRVIPRAGVHSGVEHREDGVVGAVLEEVLAGGHHESAAAVAVTPRVLRHHRAGGWRHPGHRRWLVHRASAPVPNREPTSRVYVCILFITLPCCLPSNLVLIAGYAE